MCHLIVNLAMASTFHVEGPKNVFGFPRNSKSVKDLEMTQKYQMTFLCFFCNRKFSWLNLAAEKPS
jgi:hypothetical protein